VRRRCPRQRRRQAHRSWSRFRWPGRRPRSPQPVSSPRRNSASPSDSIRTTPSIGQSSVSGQRMVLSVVTSM